MKKKLKKNHPHEKRLRLHKRNLHQGRYDLEVLANHSQDLKPYITKNLKGESTIVFSDAKAVLALNKALLTYYYDLSDWFIPEGYLCPPIPGRTDYIHHLADLLAASNFGRRPKARVLDIGTGANLIYPITGTFLYGWNFVASEIDHEATKNGAAIISKNSRLFNKIELRSQNQPNQILEGIIKNGEHFDLTMCNPPFYQSVEEAGEENRRKNRNLHSKNNEKPTLNFGGQSNELWCPGGEKRFLSTLVNESKKYEKQCFWFTSLVAKSTHLKALKSSLDYHKAHEVKVIDMKQGQKASRILAWSFLNKEEQNNWRQKHWPK